MLQHLPRFSLQGHLRGQATGRTLGASTDHMGVWQQKGVQGPKAPVESGRPGARPQWALRGTQSLHVGTAEVSLGVKGRYHVPLSLGMTRQTMWEIGWLFTHFKDSRPLCPLSFRSDPHSPLPPCPQDAASPSTNMESGKHLVSGQVPLDILFLSTSFLLPTLL